MVVATADSSRLIDYFVAQDLALLAVRSPGPAVAVSVGVAGGNS